MNVLKKYRDENCEYSPFLFKDTRWDINPYLPNPTNDIEQIVLDEDEESYLAEQGQGYLLSGEDNPLMLIRSLLAIRHFRQKEISVIHQVAINVDSSTTLELPTQLHDLAKSINKSKVLLLLKEDWDDEGSLPIKFSTWKRAVTFLVDYAVWLFSNHQTLISIPQINPGPDRSIDIVWRTSNYRMLINIPHNVSADAGYYGDNYRNSNSIKGKLTNGSVQEYFALWLKNLEKAKK